LPPEGWPSSTAPALLKDMEMIQLPRIAGGLLAGTLFERDLR
jgi:hypothetical protein